MSNPNPFCKGGFEVVVTVPANGCSCWLVVEIETELEDTATRNIERTARASKVNASPPIEAISLYCGKDDTEKSSEAKAKGVKPDSECTGNE